jgi:hypothetical protein
MSTEATSTVGTAIDSDFVTNPHTHYTLFTRSRAEMVRAGTSSFRTLLEL